MSGQIGIAAIEYELPRRCVTNDELERSHPDWRVHEVAKRAGPSQRHIAGPDETSLDLAVPACERLFGAGVVDRSEVGALIFCTQSPDYFMPGNSHLLQHRLGLPTSVLAFDYDLACSGYVYGLFMAKSFISSGQVETVLLVTADTYSRYIHPMDRGTVMLFGDGAAATIISRTSGSLGPFVFGTDGSGAKQFYIPAGGARRPRSDDTRIARSDGRGNMRTDEDIHMDGAAVLSFVKRQVPKLVARLLAQAQCTIDDVALVIFHQASGLALDELESALGIDQRKSFRNIARVANTVSASIPIALREASDGGLLRRGERALLVGFGVGYSLGACLVEL